MGSGPNRKQIVNALRNTAQSASNMVAENASVPVDVLAWALRKAGVPIGDKPVMGSDWMREKGLTAPVEEGMSKAIGDTIGMVGPMGFSKAGSQAIIEGGKKLKGLPVGNMFIGETAKTWDEVAAAQAKMMEKQGKTPQQIWKDTGTFKGADGKYRQEIDDSATVLNKYMTPNAKTNAAGEWFDESSGKLMPHPALNSAYPDMPDLPVTMKSYGKGGGGHYRENSGVVLDNAISRQPVYKSDPNAPFPISEADAAKMNLETASLGTHRVVNPEATRSTLLHELQHAIQQREGFAKGGNAEQFGGDVNSYRRLAGEAESRAVESRMNLNAKQRRELFPLDSYDVPVNQLIVK